MLNQFLVSMAVMSQLLGVPLPEAFSVEGSYVVPTTVSNGASHFEWRLQPGFEAAITPPTRVDVDDGPDIDARAAMIMDVNTQRILWQKNPDAVLPIASITKLMTALIWLDHQPAAGMDHVHTFAPEEDTPGGKELNLGHGRQLRAFDLLRSTIVGSDNDTAMALVATTQLPTLQFVELMNTKARALAMAHTSFDDPTGLSSKNVASVADVALLARAAFQQSEIQTPAQMKEHLQETVDTHELTRVATTNRLLFDPDVSIIGGKTGYTTEAGYCVVVQVRDPQSGRDIIAVVLGAPTELGRFDDAKKLALWAFEHYTWE